MGIRISTSVLGFGFGGQQSLDLIHGVPNFANLAGVSIRYRDTEFFFEREEQIRGIEAVDAEFVKSTVDGDLFGGNVFDRGNLGNDPGGQVAIHASSGRETKKSRCKVAVDSMRFVSKRSIYITR